MSCCSNHFHKPWGPLKIIGMIIVGIITAVFFALAFGYFVRELWNWLMPSLFHLRVITFWEAFGLVLLARLVFGGGHGGFHQHARKHHQKWHHKHGHGCEEWAHEDWQIKGGWHNWRHYDSWWQAEGKAGFERYIDEMKSNGAKREKEPEA